MRSKASHVVLLLTLILASISATAAPGFDAASIRRSIPTGRADPSEILRDGPQLSPVTFTMRNATVKACIRWAWNVMESQVSGPAWLATDRFDILGKSAAPASEAEFRVMLQTLLTERFRLEFHRQTKEQSVYVLFPTKNGPKFKESSPDGEPQIVPDTAKMSIAVRRARISTLTDLLSKVLFLPVLDQTGLTGYYDISINVGKYLERASGDGIPDIVGIISAGLQEELGLKLETRKVPLEFLVVDRIEKTPSEN